ncbi:MAG: pyridoxamine 5'-phosphate oxidase family protein [Acidimicrobiales bacterium]
MPRRTLEDLTGDECFALLGQERVGRVVYHDDLGPAAVPVNYALAGHDIVFRTREGSKIPWLADRRVAFQIDHVDPDNRSGWSVLARGRSEQVDFEHLPAVLRQIEGSVPLPWEKGVHRIWIVITPDTVTGRRFGDYTLDDCF